MADGLTKEEMEKLLKKYGSQTSPSTKGTGISAIDSALGDASKKLAPFGDAVSKGGDMAAKAFSTVQEAVDKNLGVFRDLSKHGANFSNDLIGLNIAAAGARLPLTEFAELIKNNNTSFAGLGGSVTRGAEAFAKMSKEYFDSGFTDSLKQLGYTNKDLNEILALQSVSVRHITKDDAERNRVAFEGASKLATEMDAMAKLTGKSREEQQEILKKQQTDMQVDAAIRLKSQQIADPVKRAEFEDNLRKQIMAAERDGRGQMMKEYVAFGTVISKEAGMQASLMGAQAEATRKAAMASTDVTLTSAEREKQANAAQMEARAAAVKDANDQSLLMIRATGSVGGEVASVLNKQAGVSNAYVTAMERVVAANDLDLSKTEDRIKAEELAREEIKKSQAGKNKEGESVDGATRAAIQLGNTLDSVRAGLTKGLLEPIRDEIQKPLTQFGQNLQNINRQALGTGKPMSQAIEENLKAGAAGGDSRLKGQGGAIGTGLQDLGALGRTGGQALGGAVNTVNQIIEPTPTPKRQGGTIDMTGNLFENWGTGTKVELHGMEGVFRPQDLEKLVEQSLGSIKKSAGNMPTNLDLNQISKTISTSINGGGTSAIKGPDLSALIKPFQKSFNDFGIEFEEVSTKAAEDIADAMPIKAFDQTAAALEFANKRRQELEDLMNDGQTRTSREWTEIFDEADQLDEQIEKLTSSQIEAMSSYADGWGDIDEINNKIIADIKDSLPVDEFGDLEGAMKKAAENMYPDTEFGDLEGAMAKTMPKSLTDLTTGTSPIFKDGKFDLDSFTMGKNNKPIIKQTQSAASTITTKTASPGKKINPETGEEYTPVEELEKQKKAEEGKEKTDTAKKTAAKEASLSDVVASLNQLNSKMGQLITKTEDLFNKQISATKSNSSNLYKAS